MDKYEIRCTEEQTRKARELGAPIEIKNIEEAPKDWQVERANQQGRT